MDREYRSSCIIDSMVDPSSVENWVVGAATAAALATAGVGEGAADDDIRRGPSIDCAEESRRGGELAWGSGGEKVTTVGGAGRGGRRRRRLFSEETRAQHFPPLFGFSAKNNHAAPPASRPHGKGKLCARVDDHVVSKEHQVKQRP
jgi:hypothetical protein